MQMAEAKPATLEQRREAWIQEQGFTTEAEAAEARKHYNAGAADALTHEAALRVRFLPRVSTRPVPLLTRGA